MTSTDALMWLELAMRHKPTLTTSLSWYAISFALACSFALGFHDLMRTTTFVTSVAWSTDWQQTLHGDPQVVMSAVCANHDHQHRDFDRQPSGCDYHKLHRWISGCHH